MEQRAAGRQPVDLDAVVVCPRFGLLRAVIVDLAPGGARVRVETNIVPIGAEVEATGRILLGGKREGHEGHRAEGSQEGSHWRQI